MRAWIALLVAGGLTGCIAYPGNFSFPDAPCRMLHGWCVIELPRVGYMAVGAGAGQDPGTAGGGLEETVLSFRFAPREGLTARWSSPEITIVDLGNNRTMQVKALDASEVTGRRLYPHINEDMWVIYGPYSPGEYRLKPRISRMEIRFPPIIVEGRTFPVAPVRIDDGIRPPHAGFYYSH